MLPQSHSWLCGSVFYHSTDPVSGSWKVPPPSCLSLRQRQHKAEGYERFHEAICGSFEVCLTPPIYDFLNLLSDWQGFTPSEPIGILAGCYIFHPFLDLGRCHLLHVSVCAKDNTKLKVMNASTKLFVAPSKCV
jgi:hypothetical protein